jgi:CRISPR-associated protein Cas2
MRYIISYDITDDKRRLRIANLLLNYGVRVQYSVFECRLNEALLAKLRARLERLLKPDEDNIRIYRLCTACEREIIALGNAEAIVEKDVYIV